MQTGKMNVTQTKNGKFEAKIHYERDGKSKQITVPRMDLRDTSLNGVEVEFESENGQIVKVIQQGKVIFPTEANAQKKTDKPQDNVNSFKKAPSSGTFNKVGTGNAPKSSPKGAPCKRDARAPYNFIPLNSKVVAWKMPPNIEADCDKYHDSCHTGVIEIEIETKTPLYIRGSLKEEQFANGKESKDIAAFFGPGGILRIPGSSLRGLTRTLVEIVSFGKFGFFDDIGLYFRGLADKSNLRNEYQKKMSSYDTKSKKSQYLISAGMLSKRGFDYFITPSPEAPKQISKKMARSIIEPQGKKYKLFTWYKNKNEYIVVSGDMTNKIKDWVITIPTENAKSFKIPDIDARNYMNDKNRADEVPNLLEECIKESVPCFYIRWKDAKNEERVSFGHTGMFRLAYEKSIGEHIPIVTILDENTSVDMAEAIFGNEKTYAGRVFFEDAIICEGQGEVCMGISTPRILSSPKPTTFQHYLEQDENADTKNYNTYNSDGSIRGNKFYWHQSGNGWKEENRQNIEQHKSQYTEINPVKPNTRFKGRIRFENLRTEELGALLFVLALPDGCYHKIGMGKPLGLGSIHIKPTLHISDRISRYTNLLAEWTGISPSDYQKVSELKKTFEDFILKKIGDNQSSTLWTNSRIHELELMLNFEKGKALEGASKMRYMEIEHPQYKNEFKDRPILVRPSEFTK
ncbi:MAG: TIGR03986 family CRISPR-associated RAMP protein [Candidatus Xenobiia bacterium LiM19]